MASSSVHVAAPTSQHKIMDILDKGWIMIPITRDYELKGPTVLVSPNMP